MKHENKLLLSESMMTFLRYCPLMLQHLLEHGLPSSARLHLPASAMDLWPCNVLPCGVHHTLWVQQRFEFIELQQ